MNIFIEALKDRKVTTEIELKRMFWRLAKKLHPDITKVENNNYLFISLKSQYDVAHSELNNQIKEIKKNSKSPDRNICMQLFVDLIASNFPIDRKVKNQNKMYCARLDELNKELGRFGNEYNNLINSVELEMNKLRGKTTVSNHEFNLVKLYFYRISDYYYLKTKNTENYLRIGYDMIIDIFRKRNMEKSILFVNWLVKDLL